MFYMNINVNNLKENINLIKKNYSYSYYLLDVRNNAFCHDLKLISYLDDTLDYLYTNSFYDVVKIRKYNSTIPILYEGEISENTIYDLIVKNVVLVVKTMDVFQSLFSYDLKDPVSIILNIDVEGFHGFSDKHQIRDILESLKNKKNISILGIKSSIKEKEYADFREIIQPLRDLKLLILNNEQDKNKIKLSNAILLNQSIYGINEIKKGFFKKANFEYKQVMQLMCSITSIVRKVKNKKELYYAIIPLGYLDGLNKEMDQVFIQHQLYRVQEVKEDYTVILVDDSIHVDDFVEITGENNPMTNSIYDFALLSNHFKNITYQ